jgi:hypothetical protein
MDLISCWCDFHFIFYASYFMKCMSLVVKGREKPLRKVVAEVK